MSRRAVIDGVAMNALRGRLTPIPRGIEADEVLKEFWNIGGVKLPEDPKEIVRQALQYSNLDARISHIIVNRLDGDLHVGMLIATPEYPATEEEILSRNGFLTYVYNATVPYFSELGYCFFEKHRDRAIYRIG